MYKKWWEILVTFFNGVANIDFLYIDLLQFCDISLQIWISHEKHTPQSSYTQFQTRKNACVKWEIIA